MDCEKYVELMSAALDGECTAEERRELDSHLAVCPECAELFRILSANAKAVRELDCEMPADLKSRIMNNLPEQEKPAKQNKSTGWTPKTGRVIHWKRWIPVAAAACLVLVVTLLPRGGSSEAPAAYAPTADSPSSTVAPGVYDVEPSTAENYSAGGTLDNLEMGSLATDQPASDPRDAAQESSTSYGSVPTDGSSPEPDHYAFENQRSIRIRTYDHPEEGAVIIGSVESLNEYLNQFKSYIAEDLSEDLQMLQNHYGYDKFFETERLLFIRVDAPSGGDRLRIADDGLFRDSVILEQTADGVTFDMGYWLIVAEVDTMFEDGDTLEVSTVKAYDRYCIIDNIWFQRIESSGHTSPSATVIRNLDELTEYLEANVYCTDPITGELIPDPKPEDMVSIYGTPVSEASFFDNQMLLAFMVSSPVSDTTYEVVTVSSDAVTVRQDHYMFGDTSLSTWLILVQAYGNIDLDNPPKLIVTDGYP